MIGLYEQNFTDTDTITVNHSINLNYIGGVRVIVGSKSRPDLISKVTVPDNDPKNSITIKLSQVSSGRIQIIETDYIMIGQASASEAATSMIFGKENSKTLSNAATKTTSANDWVEKTSITKDLESGLYRIGVSYVWSASSSSKNCIFNSQLMLDGQQIMKHRERASEPNTEVPVSFFTNKTITAGSHTLSLQFRREGGNMEVGMENANIEIWRINSG